MKLVSGYWGTELTPLWHEGLDIDKNFDYTYIVDDAIKIKNPLLAESFFNVNHIYNKNTIAKIGNMSWNITNIKK